MKNVAKALYGIAVVIGAVYMAVDGVDLLAVWFITLLLVLMLASFD